MQKQREEGVITTPLIKCKHYMIDDDEQALITQTIYNYKASTFLLKHTKTVQPYSTNSSINRYLIFDITFTITD